MTEIIPGDMMTVKTNKGNFEARKVIITAGPWGPAMVKKLGVDLPFRVRLLLVYGNIMVLGFIYKVCYTYNVG